MSENIKVITTKLPTYLQALLQENYDIKLVSRLKSELNGHDIHKMEKIEDHNESALSELELSGTPLKTDLGGDDFVCGDVIYMQPSSWTSEEAKYHPITIGEARTFINNDLMSRRSGESKDKAIYCICDGNDQQNTVILGVTVREHKLTRVLVYILPCCNEDHEVTTIEYMKRDHIKNVTTTGMIKYLVTKCYYLLGYNLNNSTSLQNEPNNGSVAIQVTSDQIDDKIAQNKFKMILQVIIGHSESPLNSFWEELCLVQSYINILANKPCETTIISEEYLDYSEITGLISELFLKNSNCLKKEVNKTLNLKNLREQTISDKLWTILKSCRKLSDLRESFHFLFEELAESEISLYTSIRDKSAVSEIINGILDGKCAVPTLSVSQSLELLIDLGLEKLKNDYLVIISGFHTFPNDLVLKKWSNLCSESVANSNQSVKRRTKISINPKSAITDVINSKLKLSYLDCMHKIAEFMFLCKENGKLTEESFDYFCEAVSNNFLINNQNINHFCDIRQLRLCEFSVDLFFGNVSIKELSPVTWSVKMIGTLGLCEVTTVFYFSEHPIFPPSIYNNYDFSLDNCDVKTLYITKLVKYVQNV